MRGFPVSCCVYTPEARCISVLCSMPIYYCCNSSYSRHEAANCMGRVNMVYLMKDPTLYVLFTRGVLFHIINGCDCL